MVQLRCVGCVDIAALQRTWCVKAVSELVRQQSDGTQNRFRQTFGDFVSRLRQNDEPVFIHQHGYIQVCERAKRHRPMTTDLFRAQPSWREAFLTNRQTRRPTRDASTTVGNPAVARPARRDAG